jgi:glycosyltransferase involved in cell wall biosynthesis
VHILGSESEIELNRLLAASDVFFLPSAWEGIELAIYEAMASGLPVVGADVGGQREVVTPDCGILTAPVDGGIRESLCYANALAQLVEDTSRRRAMGESGRARLQKLFSHTQSASRMLELIETARKLHHDTPRPRPSLTVAQACAYQAVEVLRLSRLVEEL